MRGLPTLTTKNSDGHPYQGGHTRLKTRVAGRILGSVAEELIEEFEFFACGVVQGLCYRFSPQTDLLKLLVLHDTYEKTLHMTFVAWVPNGHSDEPDATMTGYRPGVVGFPASKGHVLKVLEE